MGCREEKKDINGSEYYCVQWPASKALKMKFRMVQLFGDSFSKLASLATEEDQGAALSSFVGSLFDKSSPDEVFSFLKEVIQSVSRNGVRMSDTLFEEAYSNNLKEFYQTVAFVLKLNYSDFLGGKLDSLFQAKETPVSSKDS